MCYKRHKKGVQERLLHILLCSILSTFDTMAFAVMVTPKSNSHKCKLYFHIKMVYTDFVIVEN